MTSTAPARAPKTEVRRPRPSAATAGSFSHNLGRYGLVMLLVIVLAVFSILRPAEFATWDNLRFTLDQQAAVLIGGLAAMIPLLTDSIDLSVAANISFSNILLAGMTANDGVPVGLAVVLAILGSTIVGLANGLIVEKMQVTSFVATLGSATVLGGLGLAYSNSQDIVAVPDAVKTMIRTEVGGVPLSVFYAVACLLLVALVLRYLPVGRKLRAVGANPRAAALTGIRPGLYRVSSFVVGGLLAGVAGVVLTGQIGSATASGAGTPLLLPIFAAVFLGSTAFTPGRPNVPGLFVAAVFLAFVSSGLVLLGAPLWASPIINGLALILAVALSSWALRLRARRFRAAQLRQLDDEDALPVAT